MKKEILVTMPTYDEPTNYSSYYAGIVIREAEAKGISVVSLKRPRLSRKIFEEIIENQSPVFIFFNAHGNEKMIYGDRLDRGEEVLIEEGKNHSLLNSRIVFARACCAAASLGKACEGGCFIGYNMNFGFWIDERWSTKPANDNTAKLFFEPSNLIASSLLKGNTANEAVKKSIDLSKKNILRLMKEQEEPGATASAILLWNNMRGTEICGNGKIKFD